MYIVCADLEGVFVPEIWISVSKKTGIEKLKLTTRDVPDYDKLMTMRLEILKEHGLLLSDIQAVIAKMEPLEGAKDFLDWLRRRVQVIIVSDTFVQFADPLMEKLGRPTLFCNSLVIDQKGAVTGYTLRQKDGKRKVAQALKGLNFKVVATGDSYNDVTMLQEADAGILFCPPENVIKEFPQFPVVTDYEGLKEKILAAMS
jgi:phosphoserine/homoserine phosphotransferase